ncbi:MULTISPECIES: hypothetical protein [Acetobacter]|uniref:Energy transducer TonB n=1 Tax=Acetobacter thailandicus TaxID=1502842 RepID=A0ABT3QBN8_9PROT|nr:MULTISPECIES: hypothetical protein [Acetobacter]MBS0959118.1 hypothetical protein [Acetobacter thailandicus]MBS0980472.1 hypothetical protein [Acetobacter thailandicus]MBS0984995.1 hypothetical protein [Acetobacter thailandicus]MBS1003466.1 hypothetical protein [Acetobacter thailandicus]MCX2562700.1 hypothetical protein [Acetobacter thailandicus]
MLLLSNPPADMPKMRRSWRVKVVVLCVLVAGYGAFVWSFTHKKPPVRMERVIIPAKVVSHVVKVPAAPPAPPVVMVAPPDIHLPVPSLAR